jgi:hypothetical protein
MFRRYQVNWNRFAQPDPWDGSYNVTDPQSLNRYAYVQNDPVNFVDPSGLDDDPYAGLEFGGTLTTNSSAPYWNWGGGGAGGRHGPLLDTGNEGGGHGGGGGGGGPQRPRPQSTADQARKKKLEDCLEAARQKAKAESAKQPTWRDDLPTRDDFGIGATVGGLTTGVRLLQGVRAVASVGAGVESFGLGMLAVFGYKYVKLGLHNALDSDRISAEWSKDIKDCHNKYGK